MTLQEISDRFKIMDILTEYSKEGGPRTVLQTIKAFLQKGLGDLPRQHMISNHKIQIQGDRAKVRCLCFNPLELPKQKEGLEVMLWGLWYSDQFVRTLECWRIQERVTEPSYSWKMQTSPLGF
jgi:hypothetical protein